MAKSLLDRLSAEDYALIKEQVYYDPTSKFGLRWATELYSRNGRGHNPDDPVGKNFFVGKNAYNSSSIVLILNDIWPEDGQNVATRKDPLGSWGDVSNLEWAKHGDSRRRNAELTRVALVRSVLGNDGPDLGDRLRLNAPCPNGHLWNGHQLGLQRRWGQSWRCDECSKDRSSEDQEKRKERNKKRYQENIEEERQKAKDRMRQKRESMTEEELTQYRQSSAEYQRQRHSTEGRKSRSKVLTGFVIPPHLVGSGITAIEIKAFIDAGVRIENIAKDDVLYNRQVQQAIRDLTPSPTVARLVMDEQERYWDEKPEAKKEHNRQWDKAKWWLEYQTKPELRLYHRQKSKRRKALLREQTAHQVQPRELRIRFALFDNCCAYCGASGDMEIEHVIPISKGGTHAMGNIVPACHNCNSSKRAKDPETWYRSQPFFSELRWRKICRVLGWQRSSVGQLALL
jgi:5-methylcytosine-specific restriction endonuclease McrA